MAFLVDHAGAAAGMLLFFAGILSEGRVPTGVATMMRWGGACWLVGYWGLTVLWLGEYGQSPGKRLYGVHIRGLDGQPVSLSRILWRRNLLPYALSRIPLVGGLFPLLDQGLGILRRNRRCVHDYFAGTQVLLAEAPTAGAAARAAAALVALTLTAALFCFGASFSAFQMEGPSGEPGLLNGDRVLGIMPLPLPGARVGRGSVVVFKNPVDGNTMIKRVIGMPGDTVAMDGERVLLNGEYLPVRDLGPCKLGVGGEHANCRITETRLGSHSFRTSSAPVVHTPHLMRVPPSTVYLLGDHRDHSNDSRNPAVGAIPMDAIEAIVLSIYWSSGADGPRTERMFTPVR
jgi:signal peptidase I